MSTPRLSVVPDGYGEVGAQCVNGPVNDVKKEVFKIIDDDIEISFSDYECSDLFRRDDFNGSLYPVTDGFYFLRDSADNLIDFALVTGKYIETVIPDEVNFGEDAYQIGYINGENMYIVYAGNDRSNWKTLNMQETMDALGKIKIDSQLQ